MSLSHPSLDLFSFIQSSSFEFYNRGLLRIDICPIDENIKQLDVKITVQGQKQNSVYEEVLEYSDLFGIPKSQSKSLLWFKLYLEEYLRKVQTKLKLNKSQRQADNIFNSSLIFAEEVYMRKVYKDADKILKTLQTDSNHNNKTVNRSFLLKIDPTLLNYPGDLFQKPFVINFPRKLKPEQVILSTVQSNSQKKQTANKGIQNIFFDNKLQ